MALNGESLTGRRLSVSYVRRSLHEITSQSASIPAEKIPLFGPDNLSGDIIYDKFMKGQWYSATLSAIRKWLYEQLWNSFMNISTSIELETQKVCPLVTITYNFHGWLADHISKLRSTKFHNDPRNYLSPCHMH